MDALQCIDAFLGSVNGHATVGDSIKALHAETQIISCEHCGAEDPDARCKACKLVHYCSSKGCQLADWKAGHNIECNAIQHGIQWSVYAGEFVSSTPSASSVVGRHLKRITAAAAHDALDIEPIEGHGGGGHRGGGGGGYRRRGGGVRRGGGGYRRGYSRGWGRGRWYGWNFPWRAYRGLYYPWWYWLPASYYAQGLVYPGYGVPPYPPQNWGGVSAPPDGQMGYDMPPPAPGALAMERIANPQSLCATWKDSELVESLFSRSTYKSLMKKRVSTFFEFAEAYKNKGNVELPLAALELQRGDWVRAVPSREGELAALLDSYESKMRTLIKAVIDQDTALVETTSQWLKTEHAEAWAAFWTSLADKTKIDERRALHDFKQKALFQVNRIIPTVDNLRRGFAADYKSAKKATLTHAAELGEALDKFVGHKKAVRDSIIACGMCDGELDDGGDDE